MAQDEADLLLGSRFGHAPTLHQQLALKVLHRHLQERNRQLAPPQGDLVGVGGEEAELLCRAMIAAAHADGRLDPLERARIRHALVRWSLDEAERRSLGQLIEQPQCLEDLARRVDSQALAVRFYGVSLAAIDKGSPTSRAYLAYLALRLGLAADQVVRLNRSLGLRT